MDIFDCLKNIDKKLSNQLIDTLSNYEKEIYDKNSEKKIYKNKISLIDKNISELNYKKKSLCKDFTLEHSEILLNQHIHFQDKHDLEIKKTYYYDTEWFRNTYGKRDPYDSHGIPYDYEGPDTLIYVICKKCHIENNIYPIKEPAYSKDINSDNLFLQKIGENLFKESILKNIQKDLLSSFTTNENIM